MKAGTAISILAQPGRPDAALYHEHMALGDLAEPLGFDSLFALARTDGIMPIVRKTAQFNHHRHLIRALLRHPPARKILFRSIIG